MDIMKIESKFLTGIIARFIKKTVSKKLGYDIDLNINSIRVKIDDEHARAHLDVDARMPKEAFGKLVTGKLDI